MGLFPRRLFVIALPLMTMLLFSSLGRASSEGARSKTDPNPPLGLPPPFDCNGFPAGPAISHRVLKAYPHDPEAFTQGLVFHGGYLLEGTGRHGKSSLRKVEIGSGKVLNMVRLPYRYFGEGVTVFQERVVQLTWKSRMGFVYRLEDLALQGSFRYRGEGWGITTDGLRLIMSDGTEDLRFLDPFTFKELGLVKVRYRGVPVANLNELEYVGGLVYANIWGSD